MPDGVEVRPATVDDLDTLLDLWVDLVESQTGYGSYIEGESNRDQARDVLAQYIAGDMVAVAATDTDSDPEHIQGFVMYHLESGLYEQRTVRGIIENLFVRPEARERGIGEFLLEVAESDLADQGAEVSALSVMARNETARGFYEKRGYERHRVTYERDLDPED